MAQNKWNQLNAFDKSGLNFKINTLPEQRKRVLTLNFQFSRTHTWSPMHIPFSMKLLKYNKLLGIIKYQSDLYNVYELFPRGK